MKNILKKSKNYFFVVTFFVIAVVVFGGITGQAIGSTNGLQNPVSANSIPEFLKSIITAATEIGAIVGALSIMYGGYLYATAQGDEEKLKKAKTTVTWALVGTAVLIGAQVIITAVVNTVGGVIS